MDEDPNRYITPEIRPSVCKFFVFFSHEDNVFLNPGMTTIEAAVEFIRKETAGFPVVLFPGDQWDLAGAPPDRSSALQKYADARNIALSQGFRHRSKSVSLERLVSEGDKFVQKLRAQNGWIVRTLPPARVHIDDHKATLEISASGVELKSSPRETCHIACKSDALDYCFMNEWGGRTLDINARFQVPPRGHYWRFKAWATLANFNSRDEGLVQILATMLLRF